MPNVLHMTAAQAVSVQGPSTLGNALLKPEALTDGSFYVGVEVTTDPMFADRNFSGIPVVDYDTVIVPLLPPSP